MREIGVSKINVKYSQGYIQKKNYTQVQNSVETTEKILVMVGLHKSTVNPIYLHLNHI